MRPALQRFITRPSSLNLLRYLLRATDNTQPCAHFPYNGHMKNCTRRSTSNAVATKTGDQDSSNGDTSPSHTICQSPSGASTPFVPVTTKPQNSKPNDGGWGSRLSFAQLEFESNFAEQQAAQRMLINSPEHANDVELWSCLLTHRYRRHGIEAGVGMFWKAIRSRDFPMPTFGPAASNMWRALLNLGFQNVQLLNRVVQYADDILRDTGRRWTGLYTYVVGHLLMNARGEEAFSWHNRLLKKHPPEPEQFQTLCKRVITRKGDIQNLRMIYMKSDFHISYSSIILSLCHQEEYFHAYRWHICLMRKGDLPRSVKPAEELVKHLSLYSPRRARMITSTLVEAGVSFAPNLDHKPKEKSKISREMMNLIHGETFHVKVKGYNDDLGARWFATTWVPLDTSIRAIHALGVKEIGPMSLQSICLREPTSGAIVQRIDHLKSLGISIGQSRYSVAVEMFARDKENDLLQSLLSSNQHPDALEDWELQEKLLSAYASNPNSLDYRRTLAIRLIGSATPDYDIYNIHLRICIIRNDVQSMLFTLSDMQMNDIPAKRHSISLVLKALLQPRRRGRRPVASPLTYSNDNLGLVIQVLTGIMRSGGSVPIHSWHEIIRRLGMLGRLRDLNDLCVFLASWYSNTSQPWEPGMDTLRRRDRTQVPRVISPTHHRHPLKIIFPVSLQKAIVEWGILRAILRESEARKRFQGLAQSNARQITESSRGSVTDGLALLRELHNKGVRIDSSAVRKAVVDRLISLYGPGTSRRKAGIRAKAINPFGVEELVGRMDDFLGIRMFGNVRDVAGYIQQRAYTRWERLKRKYRNQESRRRSLKGG